MRIAAALLLCLFAAVPAHARPRHNDSAVPIHCILTNAGREICRKAETRTTGHARVRARHTVRRSDPRPRTWCAWWLRRFLDIPKSAFPAGEYNLARAFRYIGTPARGPHVGAIVVWPHHVGLITARMPRGWKVKSGNDGHRVRNRVRSLRGAIAFRWPKQRWAGL